MSARLALCAALVALAACRTAAPPPSPKNWTPPPSPKVLVDQGPAACEASLRDARPVMGTWAELQLCGPAGRDLKADADAAFGELMRLEALLTVWRPTSEVSAINRAAGQAPVHVSPETFDVLSRAQAFSERSHGLFDITFASLGLWHFDEDLERKVPTPAQVAARLELVGYRHLHLDGAKQTAFIDEAGTRIDLGGIGKGYAVDRVVALLRARGLHDFMVQAGGDLYCAGKHGAKPWMVGVRDPRDDEGGFFAVMPVEDAAFSTSGDYERFFFVDGKRYHHIIDPRTGFPATASRSATVLTASATEAEGLTKPMFILGPEAGTGFARSQGAEAVIVGADNQVAVTPGLKGRLQILHPPSETPSP